MANYPTSNEYSWLKQAVIHGDVTKDVMTQPHSTQKLLHRLVESGWLEKVSENPPVYRANERARALVALVEASPPGKELTVTTGAS